MPDSLTRIQDPHSLPHSLTRILDFELGSWGPHTSILDPHPMPDSLTRILDPHPMPHSLPRILDLRLV